jgi:hypothetical protein
MAIKANGASIEWGGYEYARMNSDGELIETGKFSDLMSRLHTTESIFFRPLYVGEWIEVTDERG